MKRLNVKLDPMEMGEEAKNLKAKLSSLIIGQDEAVDHVVNAYERHRAGFIRKNRPIATLLFLGPTGSGKSCFVEALAQVLLGDPKAFIQVNCPEIQNGHEITKLIGSPPSYVGSEITPLFAQANVDKHQTNQKQFNFVLFDEVEKSVLALWNLVLSILDKATITLNNNQATDFSKSIIFLTSNLGSKEIASFERSGFALPGTEVIRLSGEHAGRFRQKKDRVGKGAAQRFFSPEFMNRIDHAVTFQELGRPQLEKILELALNRTQQTVCDLGANKTFVFTLSPEAKEYILQEGTDVKYGARHLNRAVDRLLVNPLTNLSVTKQARFGDWLEVGVDSGDGPLTFTRVAQDMEVTDMARLVAPSVTIQAVTAVRGSKS